MKKIYFFTLAVLPILFVVTLLSSCSKDDGEESMIDKTLLCGTWRITSLDRGNGTYIDVTTYPGTLLMNPTYATFNTDGTYSGRGYFGTGSGTYKVKGNTIYTYVDGEESMKYNVLNITGTSCTLQIAKTGSEETLKVICTKVE